ncbi:hypothetical protein ACFPWW_14225 [Rhizobium sp. GCM10022189]
MYSDFLMPPFLARPLLAFSFAAFWISAFIAYRGRSRGNRGNDGVIAPAILAMAFFAVRLLLNCFWANKCSIDAFWPRTDVSSVHNGWIEFAAIVGALGVMMIYGVLVAASYVLPPFLFAVVIGSVVGRLVWLFRRPSSPTLSDDSDQKSQNTGPKTKLPFGKRK